MSDVSIGGKIWLFWANDVTIEQVILSDQIISGWLSWEGIRICTSFVYASCYLQRRRELWDLIHNVDCDADPWLIGSDFNAIRTNDEKIGGIIPPSRVKHDFNTVIHDSDLLEVPFDGPKFSWYNGRQGLRRIWACLDRILVNQNFKDKFPLVSMSYLDRASSYHYTMIIQYMTHMVVKGPTPFRFLWMWCSHEKFLPIVKYGR